MTHRPATWKIVTFGTALTGLGVAGIGLANADDERSGPAPASVAVPANAADDSVQSADETADVVPADLAPADASPESADSPTESVTDSPDVAAPVPAPVPADASPESADSPAESAWDSPDHAGADVASAASVASAANADMGSADSAD